MKAGRDLDALVACSIMGWHHVGPDGPNGEPGCTNPDQHEVEFRDLPRFSEDIAAAWEVLQRMKESTETHAPWQAFCSELAGYDEWFSEVLWGLTPERICRAALKAVGAPHE